MSDDSYYYDEVLGSGQVCSNCFALVRIEYEVGPRDRNRETTEEGYGPAERASEQEALWCECGVEDGRSRIWEDDDVDDGRFRDLLATLVRTLDARGVTLERHRTVAHSLQARRDGETVDEALAHGVDRGHREPTPSSTTASPPAAD